MEQKSIRNGFKTIGKGIVEIAVAVAQHIDCAVKAKPWVAIILTALVIGTATTAFALNCLAKKNTAEAALYDIQTKYDSLMICVGK